MLRIDPAAAARGDRVSLRALPAGFIPASSEVHDLALSPDGTSLAADIGTPVPGGTELLVLDLATGTKRAWSFRNCRRCSPASGGPRLRGHERRRAVLDGRRAAPRVSWRTL
ncbi:MAG TPA: hypothetical protein VFQ68_02685 [Streptosporangiaceae bacterium]|nr:hypothetical protein [Streptosporangiaceae bacterium]